MAGETDNIERALKSWVGAVYRNKDTASADTARRFETSKKILQDAIIYCDTYDQLLGDSATQDFPMASGDAWAVNYIDLSTLYFKNKTAGENGVVYVIGVEV